MVHCSVVCLFVSSGVCYLPVRFGQLLRCANKRIVKIMKVYIERNNMQVELIRFRNKMSTLFTNRGTMFTAYSLDGSTHHLTAVKVNILHQ